MAEAFEHEWDSGDSNLYHDGREAGEADVRNGRPYDDRAGTVPAPWAEGYADGWGETERRRAFRASLRGGGSGG